VSENWTALVERLDKIDPTSDGLIVKVSHRITADQAQRIKDTIRAEMPKLKVLIFAEGYEVVVVKKRRLRTLIKAGRRK
jgi:hypothetical protein